MTIKTFTKNNPVLSYFLLTFIISWGGLLAVIGPNAFIGAENPSLELMPLMFLAMFAGPTASGLIMTLIVYGKVGLRELRTRLSRLRFGLWWYVFALLFAPLLLTAVLLILSLLSPEFVPTLFTSEKPMVLLLTAIPAGLLTGFFEELGWTGFVIPELRRRSGVTATGLIVGIVWGFWHYPLFSAGDLTGEVPPFILLPVQLFTFLPAYRVLLVWFHDRTASLPMVMLMHAGLVVSTMTLQPLEIAGARGLIVNLAFTAALWIVVLVTAKVKNNFPEKA